MIAPDPSGSSSIRITQDGSIYPSTYLLFEEFLVELSGIFIWTQTFRETSGADRLVTCTDSICL